MRLREWRLPGTCAGSATFDCTMLRQWVERTLPLASSIRLCRVGASEYRTASSSQPNPTAMRCLRLVHGTGCMSFSTGSTRPASMYLPSVPPKPATSSSMPPAPIAFGRKSPRAYQQLESEYGANVAVAVRSSATAEDLPTASFAGQHESFLNVRGARNLFEACRRCFASIFTDRAISYRIDNGFDHFKVALSVGVMKMVRADQASSGVIFTLDTESGFRDVVFITGVYGLGENIVQGTVDPDEFYVHKPTFRQGHRVVLSRSLGRQANAHGLCTRPWPHEEMFPFRGRSGSASASTTRTCSSLPTTRSQIEDHYSAHAGHPMPMDIEWAKDADDGRLYVIQARPETVASRRTPTAFESYSLKGTAPVLATGRAVGEKIAAGPTRVIADARGLSAFRPGEVLVATSTSPDWEPVMKVAAAIVTERGGRTCHAAIVARELGVPAVVGATGAKDALKAGRVVTVCCAEGDVGRVYDGNVPFETNLVDTSELKRPRTAIMLNLGNPELALRTAMLPNDGVGLARMEFIINEHIGVHPMALVDPEKVTSRRVRKEIQRRVRNHAQPGRLLRRKAIGRRRAHRCRVLSETGDRALVGFQEQ